MLAYEVGSKTTLFDRKLQLNAAAFYYDYTDKQIRGEKPDPVFGNLEALVTIPKSHIDGFELSATARPLAGLTIAPAITLVQTRIDGTFTNVNPFGVTGNFAGEPFPYTPEWSGNLDVNYERPLTSSLSWFVGGNLSYQDSTNGGFGQLPVLDVRSYALLDLRAGIANESQQLESLAVRPECHQSILLGERRSCGRCDHQVCGDARHLRRPAQLSLRLIGVRLRPS